MSTTAPQTGTGGVRIAGPMGERYEAILTPEATAFLAELQRRFGGRREALLAARGRRQAALDRGELPDFPAETRDIREADWTVAPPPQDLLDRRVEITGPVDRKMVINALNSGAATYMADFEDSSSPTWQVMVEGQINLRDAVRREITFTAPDGREYRLNERTAVLLVRPRGWHLPERHLLVDGQPMSGSLFDFGLFFFHNARELVARGSGPYFYLPKLQSHHEAALWNDVFDFAQDALGLPRGTIRATVLIEHLLAVFEMDEILYALRDHSAGLNCGRWDYIFSYIKVFRNHPEFVLPDRAQVTMTVPFLRAYAQLVIRTCHRRGIHAIGGMAAQIPIRDDPQANAAALEKVRADKLREVTDGHDGTWVAHPGLVPVAREVFDAHMPGPNQIGRQREDVTVGRDELIAVPEGAITEQGLATNVSAALHYTESWLTGRGCVPLNHQMEDAATAEISRAQLWQWVRHRATLDDGRPVTAERVRDRIRAELESTRARVGDAAWAARRFEQAAALLERMVTADELPEFLTLEAYSLLD